MVLKGVERPHQTPSGIGQNRTCDARVRVDFGRLDREFEVADAPQAQIADGHAVGIVRAELPDAGVCLEAVDIGVDERGEIG